MYHASIKATGYSSRHYHSHKSNQFYIVSGQLLVHHFHTARDTVPFATWKLEAGQTVTVELNVWHQFEAVTDVELIEIYWAPVDADDIERADEGGLGHERKAQSGLANPTGYPSE